MLLHPMSEFDPSEPSYLHEAELNRTIPWSPDFQRSFEQEARVIAPGLVSFDGLLFDGWTEAADPSKMN
jgi:hypothetical protein